MPKIAKELSPLALKKLCKVPGQHPVGGVAGLLFQVSDTLTTSWILRVMVAGKRRSIGLGAYPGIGLASARVRAQEARNKVVAGIDPIAERRMLRSALAAQHEKQLTFAAAAEQYISAHSSSWINAKHIDQWRATLATYASPVIGNLDVSHIEDAHIEKILKPIWNTRHETAMRLRSRLERIITWTIVKKLREGPNPARWSGHLEVLLPKFERITKNHPALHWRDMAAFMVELRKQQGIAARAVEFAILTGARSNEVRRMEWSEIDWDHGLWIVPATHMGKTKKEHRVCLSAASIRVLEVQKRTAKGDIVFPGVRGQALSDMALLLVLRRMGRSDITVHGFRSTFATWVGDGEHFPIEMAQFALSHKVGTKVEQVYMRTTMVEKRRRMMDAWARHCDASATSATVVSIQSNTAASR